eukprot:jgi/Mesvir1/18505/Mv14349-RA.1
MGAECQFKGLLSSVLSYSPPVVSPLPCMKDAKVPAPAAPVDKGKGKAVAVRSDSRRARPSTSGRGYSTGPHVRGGAGPSDERRHRDAIQARYDAADLVNNPDAIAELGETTVEEQRAALAAYGM